jgi:hypothetical protein
MGQPVLLAELWADTCQLTSELWSQFSGDRQGVAWRMSGVGRTGQTRPVAPLATQGG